MSELRYNQTMNYQEISKRIRKSVLENSYKAGACHIGSALSCVDIMVELHYNILLEEDVFVFSKASGVATYYAILADKGILPKDFSEILKKYPLPSREVSGIIHSVGSLGHGLPFAVGMAFADRSKRVFVLISDGEVQEGTTYESALFARQHKLDNLFVIVDDNKIQGLGFNKDILDLETAYTFLKNTLPNFERRETIKGQGIDFMENKPEWHYKNLTKELLDSALKQI